MKYILVVLIGYLLGSLSASIFMSRRVYGSDVRSQGSGNAGATNMARVYGAKAGLITLAADMAKTAAAMWLGWLILGETGLALGGAACITGHCWPVYHGFSGGKGVSAGAAIALVIDWRVFVAVIAVFLLTAVLSKKVSLGSLCGAVTISISALLFGLSLPRILLAVYGMLLVAARHRDNILRLIAGEEKDFTLGNKPG